MNTEESAKWIGMSEADLVPLMKPIDRIAYRDGNYVPVTRDRKPERLNFYINNGVVTDVYRG